MVSRAERRNPERIFEKPKPFVIDLKNPSKFDPQKFDEFAQTQECKDRGNLIIPITTILGSAGERNVGKRPNNGIVLCWLATGNKLFVFPKDTGHARAYRILEWTNGQTVQSAGYVTLRRKWDGTFWRHIHGHTESLNLVLAPTQSEKFRREVIKARLKDHFICYPPVP